MNIKECRAIWISDVHLGTRDCKATLLCSFLKTYRSDYLFLVGDIIDGWRISSSKWYWPSDHNKVVRLILRKAEKENTKVFYITGNHDEFLRDYIAEHKFVMGNIEIVDEVIYETSKGKKIWVVHGDDYDGVTRHHRWVALAGDIGYNFLLHSNRWFNRISRLFGMPYWSLSKAIKQKVKGAVNFIFSFEVTVAKEAKKRNADGVVCGHIHHAEKKDIDGVDYFNCGDWVESCTALVEDDQGEIEIVHWLDETDHQSNVVELVTSTEKSKVSAVVNLK